MTAAQLSLLDTTTTPDLASFDVILVNSSAGKDSQAMLDLMVELADGAGVRDRIVVVHCDLGRVEWEGTRELAERQARHYGLRFEVVSRDGDLLDQVIERRAALDAKGSSAPAWPSSTARYCTSDQKTHQVLKLMTQLVREHGPRPIGRPVRILNCLGLRAQESSARARKTPLGPDSASNGKREVVRWLPIFDWTVEDVWARIEASGVEHHRAYDLGMPRLSCCFCVLASRSSLLLAAKHNPALAQEYIAAEELTGDRFTDAISMADIVAAAAAADGPIVAEDWNA